MAQADGPGAVAGLLTAMLREARAEHVERVAVAARLRAAMAAESRRISVIREQLNEIPEEEEEHDDENVDANVDVGALRAKVAALLEEEARLRALVKERSKVCRAGYPHATAVLVRH